MANLDSKDDCSNREFNEEKILTHSVVVILFCHSRSFSEGSLNASASRQKASFKTSKQNLAIDFKTGAYSSL